MQFQYHRAGTIYDLEIQLGQKLVGSRRFAVGPDQKGGLSPASQGGQFLLGDRHESDTGEPFQLLLIVDDGAQRKKFLAGMLRQETLRAADRTDHSPAKT